MMDIEGPREEIRTLLRNGKFTDADTAAVCIRIVITHNGEPIETGMAEDIIQSPSHEETRRLIKAARQRELALTHIE